MLTGKLAPERDVPLGDEILGFAAPAEAVGLELEEDYRAEVLVDQCHVDVVGAESGTRVHLPSDVLGFAEAAQVGYVVAEQNIAVQHVPLSGGVDQDDWLGEVPGPFGGCHDESDAPVVFLAAVEKAQDRLDNPTGILDGRRG